VPQEELARLLEGLGEHHDGGGPGMDCSIVPLEGREGLSLVSTTDFFYPLVEDPYLQGRIACANVLSDLYSLGVVRCDSMLMTLAASRDMAPEHRHIVTKHMIRGFADAAAEAGTRVTGGQTVLNPWPIIGGIAMAVCGESDMIRPVNAWAGCVLVLTKPLGTQLAVNGHQWLHQPDKWAEKHRVSGVSEADVMRAYALACRSMGRLNRTAARLMHVHGALGATDVTGFGLLGHANNLAENQVRRDLVFRLTHLPVLRGMMRLDAIDPNVFHLAQGRSAETSGGLLMALPDEAAAHAYIAEYRRAEQCEDGWIVGRVEVATSAQSRSVAVLEPNCSVTEV
jgi:selenide,water dikinase